MKIINIKDNSTLQEFLSEINTPSLLRVYSNNCGHCRAMENDWEKLKKLLTEKNYDDDMNIIDVESSYSNRLPDNISSTVIGYPTILALQNGNIVKDYEGTRKSNDMYDFCKEYLLKKSLKSNKKQKLSGGRKIKSKRTKRNKSKRTKRNKSKPTKRNKSKRTKRNNQTI